MGKLRCKIALISLFIVYCVTARPAPAIGRTAALDRLCVDATRSGKVAHPDDCRYYIICCSGEAYVQQCRHCPPDRPFCEYGECIFILSNNYALSASTHGWRCMRWHVRSLVLRVLKLEWNAGRICYQEVSIRWLYVEILQLDKVLLIRSQTCMQHANASKCMACMAKLGKTSCCIYVTWCRPLWSSCVQLEHWRLPANSPVSGMFRYP